MLLCAVLSSLALVWCSLSIIDAAPWRNYESQVCGDRLVTIVSLVCSGRGYNTLFSNSAAHRIRRGIVDECCRNSCSPALLELYCQATVDPTEGPDPAVRKGRGVMEEVPEGVTEWYKKIEETFLTEETRDDCKILNLLLPSNTAMSSQTSIHDTKSVGNNLEGHEPEAEQVTDGVTEDRTVSPTSPELLLARLSVS